MDTLARYTAFIANKIIPAPVKVDVRSFDMVPMDSQSAITLACPVPEALGLVRDAFKNWWKAEVVPTTQPLEAAIPEEGYILEATGNSLDIQATDIAGVRNALCTMRQLAEAERGSAIAKRWFMPSVRIEDAPSAKLRFIHLCWFPETAEIEIERGIRLAAACKFNYVVLEAWGTLRFDSHPEFSWSEFAVSPKKIRSLVKLGASLGVTLIPQLNIFGHAAAARCSLGKHALLDEHPEFEPLLESDGWSWCLSNPHTRKFLTDLVLELLAIYDNPPFFHIGCDEAYNGASCSRCAQDFHGLLLNHMLYFHDLLAQHGARAMMWHDMLLSYEDERWFDFTASGCEADGMENLLAELPKDIFICDWEYGYPAKDGKEPTWPTMRFFQEQGFDVLPSPWKNILGTRSMGRLAKEMGFPGMVITTWHHLANTPNYLAYFAEGSQALWNPEHDFPRNVPVNRREWLNRLVRLINRDAGASEYSQYGTLPCQISPAAFLDS